FLARPATGIGRWTAFLPPLVRGRTTPADLVIFDWLALRSVGLRFQRRAVCGIGFFGHVSDPLSAWRWTRSAREGARLPPPQRSDPTLQAVPPCRCIAAIAG